jgi:hypothetical protein
VSRIESSFPRTPATFDSLYSESFGCYSLFPTRLTDADDGSFGFEAYGNVIWIPDITRTLDGPASWFDTDIHTMGIFENAGSRNIVRNNLVIDTKYLFSSTGGFMLEANPASELPSSDGFWEEMKRLKWNRAPYSTRSAWLRPTLEARLAQSCQEGRVDVVIISLAPVGTLPSGQC